jgi:hypothetical protein
MSAQSPSPLPERGNEIVDLTEGISDLDVDQESGVEEIDNEDGQDARKLRKKQKKNSANRRAAKARRARELEASKKSQEREVEVNAANEGTFALSAIGCYELRRFSDFSLPCTSPSSDLLAHIRLEIQC